MQQQAFEQPKSTLVIYGVTEDGKKFRPSDWAERLCGHLSTFRNRRIYFSRLLRPAVRDGIKCVIVEPELAVEHPKIYQLVCDFATTNRLPMRPLASNEVNR
ncbi:MAG: DUF3579 domain-containing protein [Gammaproteobacteria bacterium]|nr:MAG: DUF3579 domain-containing protein [Gammaproteobacteria bacterium]